MTFFLIFDSHFEKNLKNFEKIKKYSRETAFLRLLCGENIVIRKIGGKLVILF